MTLDAPSKSPHIALYAALSQRGQELMSACHTMATRGLLPALDTGLSLEIYMELPDRPGKEKVFHCHV